MKMKKVAQEEVAETSQANVSSLPYVVGILNNTHRLNLVGLLATQERSLEAFSS